MLCQIWRKPLQLTAAQPCLWTHSGRSAAVEAQLSVGTAMVGVQDIQAASQRFARCAGLLATLFPELQASGTGELDEQRDRVIAMLREAGVLGA